ncbi:tyrosine-type recombinase/integrase [Arcanobacterium canis]
MAKSKKPKRTHRLRYGEGSFFYDAANKVWIGRLEAGFTIDGRRRRVTVSSADEDTAWKKLAAKREAVRSGQSILAVSDSRTVGEWITVWLEDRKTRLKPKTSLNDESQINRWVIPHFGRTQIRDLSADHLRKLAKIMREAGRSSTTIRYTQNLWKSAMRAASAEGYMVPQPFLLAESASKAVSTRTSIPVEDAIKLLHAAASLPDAARWVAALLQGQRQGETLGLTWDRIDLDGARAEISWQLQTLKYLDRAAGTFFIPDGHEARHLTGAWHLTRPKSTAGYRVQPLVPWMVAALKAWKEVAPPSPYGLVFPREDGRPRSDKADREQWVALQKAAKVSKGDGEYYVVHEARHTAATLLLEAGVEPEIIKAILGHSSIATQRIYQHVSQDAALAALQKVASTLQLDRA